MSKTKRKIITRTQIKNLTQEQKEYFYSAGARDAFYTILAQHADVIQLKDLCEEYEKTFKIKHPNREWHLNRNSGKVATSAPANNSKEATDDNTITEPEQTREEAGSGDQQTH